jgi:hypothetical protein
MTTMQHRLCCIYSGIQIGTLDYQIVAGHMPYLSHWKELIAKHPVFSMDEGKLLAFSRAEWNRLAKAAEDGQASEGEELLLRVCFLAVLHTFGSIKQEIPALPPLHIVQNNMARVFALAFWKHYLDSKRFRFPTLKINKLNDNASFKDIKDYLDVCFQVKEDYEHAIDDIVEAEKVAAAERALKALRNSWITPIGNKALWRWVRANLPAKYEADAQGWMSTLFLGNERTILDFDKDEIELLAEIIISECPPGTGILFAVRRRLDSILQVFVDNKEAFTVDFEDYTPTDSIDNAGNIVAAVVMKQPVQADYPTKVAYIRANAQFYLQQRALSSKSEAGKL